MEEDKKRNNPECFKQDGHYGMRCPETGEIVIPAEYDSWLYFDSNGCSLAWKDDKFGVIDLNNKIRIPFIYDEIHIRYIYVPNTQRRMVVDNLGNKHFLDPKMVGKPNGYACFTSEGGEQAYDLDCNPCEFDETEVLFTHRKHEWVIPENADRSLEEIEECLRREYKELQEMRGCRDYRCPEHQPDTQEIKRKEVLVNGYIYDRCYVMNKSWAHNRRNAARIARTNNLLMRAVKKAAKLGKRTMQSLEWMTKVANNREFYIMVYIHPQWDNDKSSYDYASHPGLSAKKERERLDEQIYQEAACHVWNIIAAMGQGGKENGVSLCFDHITYDADDKWELKELTLDDGNSWDEGLQYPAYQDIYFLHPFYRLYMDSYCYSFEDLCNINDFRINVAVRLETKEQDRIHKP